jgi:hypothetical protein
MAYSSNESNFPIWRIVYQVKLQHNMLSYKRKDTENQTDKGNGCCCQYGFLEKELRKQAASDITHGFARRWNFFLDIIFQKH